MNILSKSEKEELSRMEANEAKLYRANKTQSNVIKQIRLNAEDAPDTPTGRTMSVELVNRADTLQAELNRATCPNISNYLDKCMSYGAPKKEG